MHVGLPPVHHHAAVVPFLVDAVVTVVVVIGRHGSEEVHRQAIQREPHLREGALDAAGSTPLVLQPGGTRGGNSEKEEEEFGGVWRYSRKEIGGRK